MSAPATVPQTTSAAKKKTNGLTPGLWPPPLRIAERGTKGEAIQSRRDLVTRRRRGRRRGDPKSKFTFGGASAPAMA